MVRRLMNDSSKRFKKCEGIPSYHKSQYPTNMLQAYLNSSIQPFQHFKIEVINLKRKQYNPLLSLIFQLIKSRKLKIWFDWGLYEWTTRVREKIVKKIAINYRCFNQSQRNGFPIVFYFQILFSSSCRRSFVDTNKPTDTTGTVCKK